MTAKCLWDTQKLENLSSGKERVRVFLLARAEPQEHRPVWLEWRINVKDEVRVTLWRHQNSILGPRTGSSSTPIRLFTIKPMQDHSCGQSHRWPYVRVTVQCVSKISLGMTLTFSGYILTSGFHRWGKEGPSDSQSQHIFKLQTQDSSLVHTIHWNKIVLPVYLPPELEDFFSHYLSKKIFIHMQVKKHILLSNRS